MSEDRKLPSAWHHGPLQEDAWGWGAIQIVGEDGFRIAFCHGNYAELYDDKRRIEPYEILCYNYSLGMGLLDATNK